MTAPQIIAAAMLIIFGGLSAFNAVAAFAARKRVKIPAALIPVSIIGVLMNILFAAVLWWGGFWS